MPACWSEARKRISAIKQYSTLGSGFRIAMRDLEIRGAGNLLGAEQSGHIAAVGFELYCQLLQQSVSNLKGEKIKPRLEVQIRLDFLAQPQEARGNDPGTARLPPQCWQTPRAGTSKSRAKSAPGLPAPPNPPPQEPKSTHFPKPSPRFPSPISPQAQHRIDIYRKLAQAADASALAAT